MREHIRLLLSSIRRLLIIFGLAILPIRYHESMQLTLYLPILIGQRACSIRRVILIGQFLSILVNCIVIDDGLRRLIYQNVIICCLGNKQLPCVD